MCSVVRVLVDGGEIWFFRGLKCKAWVCFFYFLGRGGHFVRGWQGWMGMFTAAMNCVPDMSKCVCSGRVWVSVCM